MNMELLVLGGYGLFVWSAFIFTLASCFLLYAKTKKELKEQEKKFLPSLVRFDIINKERRYCYGICSCIFSVYGLVD